jgi:hypothetical protein
VKKVNTITRVVPKGFPILHPQLRFIPLPEHGGPGPDNRFNCFHVLEDIEDFDNEDEENIIVGPNVAGPKCRQMTQGFSVADCVTMCLKQMKLFTHEKLGRVLPTESTPENIRVLSKCARDWCRLVGLCDSQSLYLIQMFVPYYCQWTNDDHVTLLNLVPKVMDRVCSYTYKSLGARN